MAADPLAPDAPGADDSAAAAHTAAGRALAHATAVLTWAGSAALLAVAAVTVLSVLGRYLFNRPIEGDYELVEIGMAVAIFLYFPYTHLTGSNIVAEFFTHGLSERARTMLEAMHDAIFGAVAALFTWRLALGCIRKFQENDTTMLLAIPKGWAFLLAVIAMAMLAAVCALRVADGLDRLRR
ncbi:MAG TPA: TRAP transporter small permease [Alphaproteobacteria bacterium]|jgi:TRAP-type C4-dicarboxylate transport system permease small subunit